MSGVRERSEDRANWNILGKITSIRKFLNQTCYYNLYILYYPKNYILIIIIRTKLSLVPYSCTLYYVINTT